MAEKDLGKQSKELKREDDYEKNELTERLESLCNEWDMLIIDTSALFFRYENYLSREDLEKLKSEDREAIRKLNIPRELLTQSIDYTNFLSALFRTGYKLRVVRGTVKEFPVAKNRQINHFGFHFIKARLSDPYRVSLENLEESLKEAVINTGKILGRRLKELHHALRSLVKDTELSETDFGCLLLCFNSARYFGDTALITNDSGILKTSLEIIKMLQNEQNPELRPRFRAGLYSMFNSKSFREERGYIP